MNTKVKVGIAAAIVAALVALIVLDQNTNPGNASSIESPNPSPTAGTLPTPPTSEPPLIIRSNSTLTSLTLWVTVMVLYGATMNTGGGIAEFSFPLIIGVIAGTYSSIWVASAVVLWWYRGQRPQLSS